MFGADDQLGRHQRARPQRFVAVVHDAAHGDHARGGVNGVFHHRHLAFLGALPAGNGRDHPRAVLGHGLAQIDQHALRDREGHVDRGHLVDHGERLGVGGTDEIADLHIGRADPARERRADQGIALLDLVIVEHGLIGLDGGDQRVGLGLGVVEIDLGGRALGDEVGVTAEIALRAFELRLVLGQRALGLLDLGVDLTGVEREQQVAFVDLGAVLEMHRDDGGLQPRLQRYAGDRRHHSDRIDIDGHGFALRLGQLDGNHPRPLRALGVAAAPHPRGAGNETGRGKDADGTNNKDQTTLFHNFSRRPVLKDGTVFSSPLTAMFAPYF